MHRGLNYRTRTLFEAGGVLPGSLTKPTVRCPSTLQIRAEIFFDPILLPHLVQRLGSCHLAARNDGQ